MDTDPHQTQLQQNPSLMEPVELTPAQLSIALWSPLSGTTEDFQAKFEYSASCKGSCHAKAMKIKSSRSEERYHHTFN